MDRQKNHENVCFVRSFAIIGTWSGWGWVEEKKVVGTRNFWNVSLFMDLFLKVWQCFLLMLIRTVLFKHMFSEHNFNIGLPDNLVNVNEFLDLLESKLIKYVNNWVFRIGNKGWKDRRMNNFCSKIKRKERLYSFA